MPHPCVVCGRSRMHPNNREEEYMFFGFPVNNDERCQKWLEFCCREDLYKLTKKQLLQRMICSKHFLPTDFLNEFHDRLTCTAIPSVYDPKQSLYNITCVLCGKTRSDPPADDYDGTTFHHFPGEEFRCLKWLDFVGIDSYYRLTRKEILYCYICSRHFVKTQFLPGYNNRLIDNAIPSIKNPDEDNLTDIEVSLDLLSDTSNTDFRVQKYEPLSALVLESQACAACGRLRTDPRNKNDKYKFHPFPAYEIGRCLKWCQFLEREDLLKMSPNQIRKLVLCSRHFSASQTFLKVGPCDAVPTIKNVQHEDDDDDDDNDEEEETEAIHPHFTDNEFTDGNNIEEIEEYLTQDNDNVINKDNVDSRPVVSSKKPFVVDKPAPLAKKRGKQKRPTAINIPKPLPIPEVRVLRKLPLPPAVNNWKFQFQNQFQPITIANNIQTIAPTITKDGKKVILPFTGNISNLGTPIPVSSLSCIPPGLLFKVNLPQQKIQSPVSVEKPKRKRGRPARSKPQKDTQVLHRLVPRENYVNNHINNFTKINEVIMEEIDEPETFDEMINFKVENETNVVESEENFEENDGTYNMEELEFEQENHQEQNLEKNEQFVQDFVHQDLIKHDDAPATTVKNKKLKRSNPRCRRTILPIKLEVNRFFKTIKPHINRLPKHAKANLKLKIVNMIIENW